MTNKKTRREFIVTAAATLTGLAIGAFRAEQPAPVVDVQAVPLGDRAVDDTHAEPGPGMRTVADFVTGQGWCELPPIHVYDYGLDITFPADGGFTLPMPANLEELRLCHKYRCLPSELRDTWVPGDDKPCDCALCGIFENLTGWTPDAYAAKLAREE